MNITRRADIDRFLDAPPAGVRAALIWGRDRGQVRERADRLAAAATADPDDPFNTARLTDADIDRDPAALEGELTAQSLVGGRRLVRLRLSGERAAAERAAADALKTHAEGGFNPDAFFLIEAGALGRDFGPAPRRRARRRLRGDRLLRGRARRRGAADPREPGQGQAQPRPRRAGAGRLAPAA